MASITTKPAMMAFVVAMAWMMFPAMPCSMHSMLLKAGMHAMLEVCQSDLLKIVCKQHHAYTKRAVENTATSAAWVKWPEVPPCAY